MVAGGIFVSSAAIIAYNLPPTHTIADVQHTAPDRGSKNAQRSFLKRMSDRVLGKSGYKSLMSIRVRSRATRGIFGIVIGSISLGVEDLYITLNLSGLTGNSSKY